VIVGPIAWVGLRRAAAVDPARLELVETWKAGALVKAGAVVTVVVPKAYRTQVSLLHRTATGRRVTDGEPAVTFRACDRSTKAFSGEGVVGPYTGFPGGFIVAGARCVPLDVWGHGRPRPYRVVVSFAAAKCGGAPPRLTAGVPAGEAGVRTTVYFLTDRAAAPIGVRRTIEKRSPYAREALRALLAGPSEGERRAGVTSALPPQARLISLSFKGQGGSVAVVNLAGLPPAQRTSALTRLRVITQVARTLIGVSGVERVSLRADGRRWGLTRMDGRIEDAVYDYDRLAGLHVCGGRSEGERARGLATCFTAVP